MPIWSVAFYDGKFDSEPCLRGVMKANTQGEAYVIVKDKMGETQRADLIPALVRDEAAFPDGYRELASN